MAQLPHKNQIRWACRRGMLELDRFLLLFFDDCFDDLSAEQQAVFVDLLNAGDQELYQWLLGTAQPESSEQQRLCAVIREYAQRQL